MLFDAYTQLIRVSTDGSTPELDSDAFAYLDALSARHIRGALALTPYSPSSTHPILMEASILRNSGILREYIREAGYRIRLHFAPLILYSQGLFRDVDMHRYLIPKTNLLPVRFPNAPLRDDWIRDLSSLMHRQHITPILFNFEDLITFDGGFGAERLIKSSGMIYEISAHTLCEPTVYTFVSRYLALGRRFLVGSYSPFRIRTIADDPLCLDSAPRTLLQLLLEKNNEFRREISVR